MPTTKRRLSLNLSDREINRLAALSEEHDVSMAWLGRRAVQEFLERHSGKQQLPLQLVRPARVVSQ